MDHAVTECGIKGEDENKRERMKKVNEMLTQKVMTEDCLEYLKDVLPVSDLYIRFCKCIDENMSWFEIQSPYLIGILESSMESIIIFCYDNIVIMTQTSLMYLGFHQR